VALEEDLQAQRVGAAHFEPALRLVRPRTDAATLRFYRRFEQLSVHGAASAGQPADAESTPAPAPFAFGPLPQGGSTVPTEFVSSGPPAE